MITHDRFDNAPSPVRVLMSAHGFASDVPPEAQAELLARYHARVTEEAQAVALKRRRRASSRTLRADLLLPDRRKRRARKKKPPKTSARKLVNPDDVRRLHAQGKTVAEMQQILSCTYGPIYRWLRELGIEPTQRARVAPGEPYGQLTVLRFLRMDPKKGRIFLCVCACGNEPEVAAKDLRAQKRTSCGCAARIWRKRTDAAVAQAVVGDVEAGGYSMCEVAKRNGVSRTQVGRLLERDRMQRNGAV